MSDQKKPNANSASPSDGTAMHHENAENGDAHAEETLLEFPCDFPIKIMGLNNANVRAAVNQVISDYERSLNDGADSLTDTLTSDTAPTGPSDDTIPPATISEQPSRTGKYVSLTVTLRFFSKPPLDQMYQRFISIEGVSMVL